MTQQLRCDALIIGAGPAGSSAALKAAKEGLEVILVDKKPRIGERPHCGEFVPYQLFMEHDLNRNAIVKQVDYLETWILESKSEFRFLKSLIPSKGFIIDRPKFDRNLADEAATSGAFIMSSASFVAFEDQKCLINAAGEYLMVKAEFVVAADGAYSAVRKKMGMETKDCLVGCQFEVPLNHDISNAMVFLDRDLFGGYGWLFPKGSTANLGIGMITGADNSAASALRNFSSLLTEIGLTKKGWLARKGGVIPYRGIRMPLTKDNVLFCGDAAGLAHPITGAGISQAVYSGYLAAQSIVKAIKFHERSFIREYSDIITGKYGAVFNHALSKKTLLVKSWNQVDFAQLCEKTWISFKGYRKRERDCW